MIGYDIWKMVFSYANQPTVIDIACAVEVVDEVPPPSYLGKPLKQCESKEQYENLSDLVKYK